MNQILKRGFSKISNLILRSIMSIEDQFASYRLQKLSEQSNYLVDRSSRNSKGFFLGFNRNSQQKNSDQSLMKNNDILLQESHELSMFEQHGAIIGGSNRSSDKHERFSLQNNFELGEKELSNKDQSLELVLEWNDATQLNPDELQEMIKKLSIANNGKEDPYLSKPDRLSLIPQQKYQVNYSQSNNFSQGCNCKKTKCLKLYCQCFRNNKMCTYQCECQECFNNEEHNEKLLQVKQQIIEKNPQAFFQQEENMEKQEEKQLFKITCNCKKSKCIMKYCECFNLGQKCSEFCQCFQCKNIEVRKELLLHSKEDKKILTQLMEEEIGEEGHKKVKME